MARRMSAAEVSGSCEQGGGGLQVGQHGLADDGAEQILLGGEVEVDRAFADAGGGGDVLQLGGGKAAVGEQTQGRLDDLAGAGFLAASAAPGQGLGVAGHGRYLLTGRSVFKGSGRRMVNFRGNGVAEGGNCDGTDRWRWEVHLQGA